MITWKNNIPYLIKDKEDLREILGELYDQIIEFFELDHQELKDTIYTLENEIEDLEDQIGYLENEIEDLKSELDNTVEEKEEDIIDKQKLVDNIKDIFDVIDFKAMKLDKFQQFHVDKLIDMLKEIEYEN